MENIDEIFSTALKDFADQAKSHRQFAMKTLEEIITPDFLSKTLKRKKNPSDELKRRIAAKLNYPGAKYEDFLNIGRHKLGLIPGEEPDAPEGETVTISREEYEALKAAAQEKPGDCFPVRAGLDDIKGILTSLTVHTDHEEIKNILKAIATATLGQIEAVKGQIEATKQADMDIIKAIKQNKIEEYEKALAHLRQDLKEKNQQIENLGQDQYRLKTRVECKVDHMFTLVGGKNGGNCDGEKVA